MLPVLLSLGILFPPPLTPEVPVSQPRFGVAANAQYAPMVASNGDIALAVWQDSRNSSDIAYASRVSSDGVSLDPLGIPLGTMPSAVVWDGSQFIVVGSELVYIGTDGVVRGRRRLAVPDAFTFAAAIAKDGIVRLLFINQFINQGPAPGRRGVIFDGAGDIVADNPTVWTPTASAGNGSWMAGSTGNSFLILHDHGLADSTRQTVATVLDPDGRILSEADSGITDYFQPFHYALSGGDDGYLLVEQRFFDSAVIARHLDRRGVADQPPTTISPADSRARTNNPRPAVLRMPDKYIVAWATAWSSGAAYGYATDVSLTGDAGAVRQIDAWPGIPGTMALTSLTSRALVVTSVSQLYSSSGTDVFAQTLSNTLEPGTPQAVALTAVQQNRAQVAASRFGYLATWSESGPDGYAHLYARRFSYSGAALDAEPIELARREGELFGGPWIESRIVANPDTYLIVWKEAYYLSFRRMSALTGALLDAQPVPMFGVSFDFALATNGRDALLAWGGSCAEPYKGCMRTRRIRMVGEPLVDPEVIVSSPAYPGNPAIASNGEDYLLAWQQSEISGVVICTCTTPPTRIMEVRLRADGSSIDAAPVSLDDRDGYPRSPSVAWNRTYLVSWSVGAEIRGTRITNEGAVLDRDGAAAGVVLDRGILYGATSSLVSFADGFLLFIRNNLNGVPQFAPWTVTPFTADVDLSTVARLPRASVPNLPNSAPPQFQSGVFGSLFVIGYERTGTASEGRSERVVTRVFGEPPRRRAIGR